MHLDGWSLAFQALNFLVLLFLLHRYLWRPVTAMIERRRKELLDASAEAKAKADAADESRRAYEARGAAVDRARARLLAESAAEIAAEREAARALAREAMDAEAAAAREKIGEERRAAARELAGEAVDLAVALARRLLGEVRGAAIADAFLDRICEHLDGLPAEDLAELCAEIEASPTIQVATAPALEEAAKGRLRARLAARLGARVTLDFVTDDALIAGAELRFHHARLGHSFMHSLSAAERELLGRGEPAGRERIGAHGGVTAREEIAGT